MAEISITSPWESEFASSLVGSDPEMEQVRFFGNCTIGRKNFVERQLVEKFLSTHHFVEEYFVEKFSSTKHFVDRAFRRQHISSTAHFIDTTFRRHNISSTDNLRVRAQWAKG
jgi:hypothetical protein